MARAKKRIGGGKGGVVIKIIVIGGIIFVAWDYLFNCSNIIKPMKALQVNPKCGSSRFVPLSPRPGSVEEARRLNEQKTGRTPAQDSIKNLGGVGCAGWWDFLCHLRNAGERFKSGVRSGVRGGVIL